MPATNKLSDAKCKAAKPQTKSYKISDGQGLYLWVSTTGAKVWRRGYRIDGKEQTLVIGSYPAISLAEARTATEQHIAALKQGRNPVKEARIERKGALLGDAYRNYWRGRVGLSEGYQRDAIRAFDLHIAPHLENTRVADIDRRALLDVLLRLDSAGQAVNVRRLRMWLDMFFDYAVELEYCATNPAASINPARAFKAATKKNFPALTPSEALMLWPKLSDAGSGLLCKFQALTWLRPTEARFCRLDWIRGDTLHVPASVMKKHRDHVVPLSVQAQEIAGQALALNRGSSLLFPGPRGDKPMSENTVLFMLYDLGYKNRMTAHGWRSVGSTWANENGFNADVIERQLSHEPDDKVRAAYNRAEYLAERRLMLQSYADWIAPMPANLPA